MKFAILATSALAVKVTLYSEPLFKGTEDVIYASMDKCTAVNRNDRASSARIDTSGLKNHRYQICFYDHWDCRGAEKCWTVNQIKNGPPSNFARDGLDNKISALKIITQCRDDQVKGCEMIRDGNLGLCYGRTKRVCRITCELQYLKCLQRAGC